MGSTGGTDLPTGSDRVFVLNIAALFAQCLGVQVGVAAGSTNALLLPRGVGFPPVGVVFVFTLLTALLSLHWWVLSTSGTVSYHGFKCQ